MTTINHESETVSLGYWKVMIVRDEDDHLGERFTTEAIEKRVWSERYRETIPTNKG